jgi:hypothetical protein
MHAKQKKLSFFACYESAWTAFRKWWIPLCLISGLLFVFQLIPRTVVQAEKSELSAAISTIVAAAQANDVDAMLSAEEQMLEVGMEYAQKMGKFTVALFPLVAVVTVLLLIYANAAMNDFRKKQTTGRILYISAVHVLLAVIKGAAMVLVFPLGIYLYIKWLFVSFVLLEEEASLGEAIRRSAALTKGNFFPLLGLVVLNGVIQLISLPTLIGIIPATGFVNTVRAAAYVSLRDGFRQAPAC